MKITKMPSKRMLEKYLDGKYEQGTVIFNVEKGKFEYINRRKTKK